MKEARKVDTSGIGKPELAPVSTGLGNLPVSSFVQTYGFGGEIYPMELRLSKTGIVRRQLSGGRKV